MKRFFFFMFFLSILSFGNSQTLADNFLAHSDSLSKILFGQHNDNEKLTACQHLENITYNFLLTDTSLLFNFDSLLFARFLTANDKAFSILTWVIPLSENRYHYSGFIQKLANTGTHDEQVYAVYKMIPQETQVELNSTYPIETWPPAVYNQILPKDKMDKYYTLLGWTGKPEGLAGKTIETVAFDSLGQPAFGIPAFSLKTGSIQNRVDFEYTNEMPFHLSYEVQRLPDQNGKTSWMIIFNRIEGNTPGMGKMFSGPVPSFQIFDAFVKIGETWILFEDVDPRADTKDLNNVRPSEMGLPKIRKN